MILSMVLTVLSLIGNKASIRLPLLAVAITYALSELALSTFLPSRLAVERLESERWSIQLEALEALASFKYPFGGFISSSSVTPWLHNGILDLYRVSGILPALGLSTLILYAGWKNFSTASEGFRRVLAWGIGTTIAMTSVIFEGHILEWIYFLLIIFNYHFLSVKQLEYK
jgi:hypothetical protein